jgi:hypothetical protein
MVKNAESRRGEVVEKVRGLEGRSRSLEDGRRFNLRGRRKRRGSAKSNEGGEQEERGCSWTVFRWESWNTIESCFTFDALEGDSEADSTIVLSVSAFKDLEYRWKNGSLKTLQ